MRFPVQYVIRPMSHEHHDYRGYGGQVASGMLRPGDEVVVLPSGFTTTIAGIDEYGGPIEEAIPPMSVSVRLADDVDVSRGDMICRPNNMPDRHPGRRRDGVLVQRAAAAAPARPTRSSTRRAPRRRGCSSLHYRLDVNTLHRDESAPTLELNDLGRVTLRTAVPLFVDEYRRNRTTGSFILIDEGTFETVGAGMILGA